MPPRNPITGVNHLGARSTPPCSDADGVGGERVRQGR